MKRILLSVVAAAIAVPTAAWAEGDDKAYCAQLTYLYRKYVQNSPGRGLDLDAARALEDCSKGNAAAAIPVLERKLRENRISVPGGEFKP
jgi:hypothetical protein